MQPRIKPPIVGRVSSPGVLAEIRAIKLGKTR